jgi:5-methylcytosine-specific restriction endonuclease McrA
MNYLKTAQTAKTVTSNKICTVCKKNRDIRFFSSKLARECGDCKRKKWTLKLKNRPSKIKKREDDLWSLKVKELAGHKCEYCGKTENLNSHHIFSRSNHKLRFDTTNGISLCSGHHVLKSDFSAHKTPADFIEWIKEYRGLEWYEELRRKAKKI